MKMVFGILMDYGKLKEYEKMATCKWCRQIYKRKELKEHEKVCLANPNIRW